ncbi:MAG: hypothetical protein LBH43_04400 [Treponema sp.]|jgi:hypothetical protein|nr:hypothetical protein [Treponema sp.]
MAEKPENRKAVLRFLRRSREFRRLEKACAGYEEAASRYKDEKAALQRKIVSDASLAESLFRHIEALERKAEAQAGCSPTAVIIFALTAPIFSRRKLWGAAGVKRGCPSALTAAKNSCFRVPADWLNTA